MQYKQYIECKKINKKVNGKLKHCKERVKNESSNSN